MKILASRGKNLASLAGEFAIAFHEEPLASAGLFAICGPTGSGKSTVLDALCLALYDKTPRLNRDRANSVDLPDVGKSTLGQYDPRYLLRRGTGDGYAEVDFVGNDGVAYRARWSVQRAHRKTDRAVQDTHMELKTLLESQSIGGKKSEVLEEIEQRLGLRFEQFTRAVLLAQNEFAAFLKARDNERAELLQTLTGLDIYEKLSKRAHERAKAEQDALNLLNRQAESQQVATDEERDRLKQQLRSAQAEVLMLERRKAELQQGLRWHETWAQLQQSERQAQDAVQAARAAQQLALVRQTYLDQVEAAQDARALVADRERIDREIAKSQQTLCAVQEQWQQAQRQQQQAEEDLAQAQQAVVAAEQARTAADLVLRHARTLDTEIKLLLPDHAAKAKALAESGAVHTQARQKLTAQQQHIDQTTQQLHSAQHWLATHEPVRLLAEDWSRWDLLFTKAAQAHQACSRSAQAVDAARYQEQHQKQAWVQATAALATAKTALQKAEDQLQAATQALTPFDAEAVATRRAASETRQEQLVTAERLWDALVGALTHQQTGVQETATVQQTLDRAEAALSRIRSAQPPARARLEQAETSLQLAAAACAASVETLREHLQPDKPCPVCGATTHPYALGAAPSRALLASLQAEVAAGRQALAELERQEATQQTHSHNSRQRLAALAAEQQALADAVQHYTAAWNAQDVAAETAAMAPTERRAWLAAQRQAVQAQLAALRNEETAQRQASAARERALAQRESAQQRYATTAAAAAIAQTALDQATQALQTALTRQEEAATRLNSWLNDLDAPFGGSHWRTVWQAAPTAFQQAQQADVRQWRKQQETLERLQIQLDQLAIDLRNLTASATEKTAQYQAAVQAFTTLEQVLQDKQQRRQTLCAGRPAEVLEAELASAIDAAKRALHHQNAQARQAADAFASAKTLVAQTIEMLNRQQQAATEARTALESWIARFNAQHPEATLDAPRLAILLSHDQRWRSAERAALQALADQVRDAEIAQRDRQDQREEHERQRPLPESAAALAAEQQDLQTALPQAQQMAMEIEMMLRQDNERKMATAALQQDIAQQAARLATWQQLKALIGAADGAKFRNYAQRFTLDVLLGYANHHLANLARRYRLERVKDSLALMVVDQDMGDEIRSVYSLSGGESFLVSLALALGLASLSSHQVRVESLFIDEGFGSLDADTLRIAMDALDNLQAQGRKVGVISHVQEMTERIGVQIQVQRQLGGQSRVEVRGD